MIQNDCVNMGANNIHGSKEPFGGEFRGCGRAVGTTGFPHSGDPGAYPGAQQNVEYVTVNIGGGC